MGRVTIRIPLKTIAMNFPANTIERTYLHGMWQKERGRGPTMLFGNHTDARKAFSAAKEMVGPYIETIWARPFSRQHDWSSWVEGIQNRVPATEL